MPILVDAHGWVLETARHAYAIGLTAERELALRYWGPRLPHHDDYPPLPAHEGWASFNGPEQLTPHEYPTFRGNKFIEPCLKTTFADGVRDTHLTFQRFFIVDEEDTLTLRFDDAHYPLRVYLVYRLLADLDVIERYVELQNHGDAPVTLERAFSAAWHLPSGRRWEMIHFAGRWFDEWQMQREPLARGITRLDSKRGTSSHHHHPAAFFVAPHTTETSGECWFVTLEHSGNWALLAEHTDFDTVRLSMGLNDWDYAHRLEPGSALVTPSVFLGWSADGLQDASHRLHALARRKTPHPQQLRPVLYNSWEATAFDVDLESQKQYAEIAAELGVELFVMDDGWFHGRSSDAAGLGDWFPDARKFPNGLKPLIDHVKALGMQFGLWIEPEMVSPDSDLYRAHPEWALHFPTRPRTTARNQLVLNLARSDVQEHLIATLTELLSANDIAFVKWDMNRSLTEAHWERPEPKEIWWRYVEGVYRVWGTLRERFPQVLWEACSGGGGRADLGILRWADQVWLSDNTEPTRRLLMQHHYLALYPPQTMASWVTDMGWEQMPLAFRFHVSMCGSLGIGANITHWDEAQKAAARALIAQYKAIRPIVQQGRVYRHEPDPRGGYYALHFVSPDQRMCALFVFRAYSPEPAHPYAVTVRGLLPDVRYYAAELGLCRSGKAWASVPLRFDLRPFESRLYVLQAEYDGEYHDF